ncbi:MAG TPA: MarR family transcriptional regulator [Bacillales bacterium]|nr:MarR family transcriptional regulator [Bacillales bacterium]HEU5141394.1 MarR family transcriptional regulator [Bacillales bacterium]
MAKDLEKAQQVVRSFRKVNKALYRLLREEAEVLDATVVQILVLRVLSQNPNIGLNELAERLQLGNSTMSGVVDRLVSAGLVVRERSHEDRRSLTMRLTNEGKAKQNEAFGDDSFLVERLSRILEIPGEDLEHLLRIHDQILEKWRQGDDKEEESKSSIVSEI